MKEIKNVENFNYDELLNLNFGELEGEDDRDTLKSSLVLTKSIIKLLRKDYNYVLSPKGAGKSAIFNAFKNKLFPDDFVDYKKNNYICINDSFVFDDDYLNPKRFKHNLDNKNYTFAWGLYLVSKLIVDITKNYSNYSNYSEFIGKIRRIENFKEDFDLTNLWDKIESLNLQCDFVVNGQQFRIAPKIGSKNKRTRLNLNYIFQEINNFYKAVGVKTKILIDRIDNFVGSESYEIQKKYIQGLVTAIEEIRRQSNIQPVLFLRTDLYHSLKIRFEYDKAKARTIHLVWTKTEILRFLTFRFLSNKYVSENYEAILYHSFLLEGNKKRRFEKLLGKIPLFRKRWRKVDLERNTNHKIFENFLLAFLPKDVLHFDINRRIEEIDLFQWLYTHFKDDNEYINPRCLIYFFNKLLTNQFDAYEENVELRDSDFYCNKTFNRFIHLNIFVPEVIHKTYEEIRNEELIGVMSLLDTQRERKAFEKINEISWEKGFFLFGDINYKKFNLERGQYERLVKYLDIVGFCKVVDNQKYSIPLIYRKKMDLECTTHNTRS